MLYHWKPSKFMRDLEMTEDPNKKSKYVKLIVGRVRKNKTAGISKHLVEAIRCLITKIEKPKVKVAAAAVKAKKAPKMKMKKAGKGKKSSFIISTDSVILAAALRISIVVSDFEGISQFFE